MTTIGDLLNTPDGREAFIDAVETAQIQYEFAVLNQGLSTEDNFLCSRCHHFHYATSGVGQRHTKYRLLSSAWKKLITC